MERVEWLLQKHSDSDYLGNQSSHTMLEDPAHNISTAHLMTSCDVEPHGISTALLCTDSRGVQLSNWGTHEGRTSVFDQRIVLFNLGRLLVL